MENLLLHRLKNGIIHNYVNKRVQKIQFVLPCTLSYLWYLVHYRLYRYVTHTNVPFFDLNTRLGLGSKNETFVRVT